MPADYTHYIFADKLIKKDYKKIATLASQGPDIFFFYGLALIPRKKGKEVRHFGHLLHNINPLNVYSYLIDYSLKQDKKTQNILLSFTKGFIYHYTLDRKIHPFVLDKTDYNNPNKKKKKISIEHQYLETSIDTLLEEIEGYKLEPNSMYDIPIEQVTLVSVMLSNMAKEVFNVDYIKDDTYLKAFKDYRKIKKILYSKRGKKKKIFDIFFKNTPLGSMSHPLKVKDDYKDALNKKREIWINPNDKKKRTDTVLELFENAKFDALIVDEIINKAIKNKDYKSDLKFFINNLNHLGLTVK